MGGALKRREMISARFADILSELYLLSAVLKRWQDEGRQDADFPLVKYSMEAGLSLIAQRFDELYANLPLRPVAWLLRFMVLPLGPRHRGVNDDVMRACAEILMEPSAARDRLTPDIYQPHDGKGLARLNTAFKLVTAVQPIHDRMRKAKVRDPAQALATGLITQVEADQLQAVAKAVLDAVSVDDFSVEELTGSPIVNAHVGDRTAVNKPAVQAAE
jgi:acyl-CoA dehydrogenase